MPNFDPKSVCTVVLAGGMGSRMGGVDKGLQLLAGEPLARHCVQRLQAQSGGAPGLIAINANRNAEVYAAWSCPVWADDIDGFAGPLAGFQTALQHCSGASTQASAPLGGYRYLLTVACDTPRFPLDLLARLMQALEEVQAVGLEHALAGQQPAEHTKAGIRQERGTHEQQTQGGLDADLLEHDASENGAKEGATHIPHEDFCWAPIPEQKAKQGTHKGPEGRHAG